MSDFYFVANEIALEGLHESPATILDAVVPENFICGIYLVPKDNSIPDFLMRVEISITASTGAALRAKDIRVSLVSTSNAVRKMQGQRFSSPEPPAPPIQRWQLDLVASEFHRLLDLSVRRCIAICHYDGDFPDYDNESLNQWTILPTPKKLTPQYLRSISREVQKLSHRKNLTPEFLQKVADIYNAETQRAIKAGTRIKTTQEIVSQLGTIPVTADLWVKKAREMGLIPESTRGK